MPAPRAILVDIGETLFKERPMDRQAAAEALAARFGALLPGAEELEAAQADRPDTWTVLGWLETMLPAPLAAEAEILCWESGVRMEPMPGAREALAAFRAARIPVGAVSNTRFSEPAWLHAMALHGLAIDFVVSSADVKARKPDPAIFEAALGRLGLPAGDVWFVGDSYEKDVLGAAAAGLFPVWFGGPGLPRRSLGEGGSPLPSCAAAAGWTHVLSLWKSAATPGVS
ncbi:MAG: HAD family hydrolase [Planctomycetes bacterium]|nr:HAD family hydrolase [Planctomycetota bacterium]